MRVGAEAGGIIRGASDRRRGAWIGRGASLRKAELQANPISSTQLLHLHGRGTQFPCVTAPGDSRCATPHAEDVSLSGSRAQRWPGVSRSSRSTRSRTWRGAHRRHDRFLWPPSWSCCPPGSVPGTSHQKPRTPVDCVRASCSRTHPRNPRQSSPALEKRRAARSATSSRGRVPPRRPSGRKDAAKSPRRREMRTSSARSPRRSPLRARQITAARCSD